MLPSMIQQNRNNRYPTMTGPRQPLNTAQFRPPCRLVTYSLAAGVAWVHTEGRPECYRVLLYPEHHPDKAPCTCLGQKAHGRCYHVALAWELVFQAVGTGEGLSGSALRASGRSYSDFMTDDLTEAEKESDFRQWSETDIGVYQVLWGGVRA